MTKRHVDEGLMDYYDRLKKALGRSGPAPEPKAKPSTPNRTMSGADLDELRRKGKLKDGDKIHRRTDEGQYDIWYNVGKLGGSRPSFYWTASREHDQGRTGVMQAMSGEEAEVSANQYLKQRPAGKTPPPRIPPVTQVVNTPKPTPPVADKPPTPVVASPPPQTKAHYERPESKPAPPAQKSSPEPESNAPFRGAGVGEAPDGTALTFIQHHLRKDPKGIELLSVLHGHYATVANKHKAPVIALDAFAARLTAFGFKVEKSGPGHIVRGIKYLPYINPNRTEADMNKALDDHREKWAKINNALPNQGKGKDDMKESKELNEYQIRHQNAAKDRASQKAAGEKAIHHYDAWREKKNKRGGHLSHVGRADNEYRKHMGRRVRRVNRYLNQRKKRVAEALELLLRKGDAVAFHEAIVSELYRRAKDAVEADRIAIAAPLMVSEGIIGDTFKKGVRATGIPKMMAKYQHRKMSKGFSQARNAESEAHKVASAARRKAGQAGTNRDWWMKTFDVPDDLSRKGKKNMMASTAVHDSVEHDGNALDENKFVSLRMIL